jgi:hypothetical protein
MPPTRKEIIENNRMCDLRTELQRFQQMREDWSDRLRQIDDIIARLGRLTEGK